MNPDYTSIPSYPCQACLYMMPWQCMYMPYMQSPYMAQMPVAAVPGIEDYKDDKNDKDDNYRQPPFYGPRPVYPPFFGPPRPPFYPPPFIVPRPIFPPFFGFPFLTGLALGGLLF